MTSLSTVKIWCILSLLISGSLVSCGDNNKLTESKGAVKNLPDKNVVFILVDDLGWKDLGCYGSSFYESPNIDRLAASSHKFVNAYTPNPVCSPTRAAIMTGKYPTRVGITDWIPGHDYKDREFLGPVDLNELPLKEVTIAEALKKHNYKTFFAGKWHLGSTGFFPEDQGFDLNFGGHHMGHPPGGYYAPYNNPKLSDGEDGEYLTDRLTDESIKFIEANKNQPFFLCLAYYTVHTPIEPSKKFIKKFQDKKKTLAVQEPLKIQEGLGYVVQNQYDEEYASMVYALDENVGRILNTLDTLGLDENTLVIFTSDNGGLAATDRSDWSAPTSVLPLRAGKGWAYEGGIKVPLIIRQPQQKTGKQILAPVISMDLFPTILEELALDQQPELHQDGVSLTSLMNGDTENVHEVLFYDYPHYHASGWTPGSAIRKGDWKLVYLYEGDKYELYNLKNDIGERQNLASKELLKLREMKEELRKMKSYLGAVEPTRN